MRFLILLIIVVALGSVGCSSLSFREGYRLQTDKLEKPVVNACHKVDSNLEAAVFELPKGQIRIYTGHRVRTEFFGPVLVPLIPLKFNSQEELMIVIAPLFEDAKLKFKTDLSKWMISKDGVSWVNVQYVIRPFSNGEKDVPMITEIGTSHYVVGFSRTLVFPFKTQDVETLYLKTAPMTFEGATLESTVIRWSRENYTQYTPFWGFPHVFPKTTPNCS